MIFNMSETNSGGGGVSLLGCTAEEFTDINLSESYTGSYSFPYDVNTTIIVGAIVQLYNDDSGEIFFAGGGTSTISRGYFYLSTEDLMFNDVETGGVLAISYESEITFDWDTASFPCYPISIAVFTVTV